MKKRSSSALSRELMHYGILQGVSPMYVVFALLLSPDCFSFTPVICRRPICLLLEVFGLQEQWGTF